MLKMMTKKIEKKLLATSVEDVKAEGDTGSLRVNAFYYLNLYGPSCGFAAILGRRMADGDLALYGVFTGDFPEEGSIRLSELQAISKEKGFCLLPGAERVDTADGAVLSDWIGQRKVA